MSLDQNVISVEIADETITALVDLLKQVEAGMPFAITISKEDRMGLPKVGAETFSFIDKAYEFASRNPDLVPGFLDLAEFTKDAEAARKLNLVRNHLVPLVNKFNDTFSVASAEAYFAARVFYHHVKNAAKMNVPGASAVADELKKYFINRTAKPKEQKEEIPTETS